MKFVVVRVPDTSLPWGWRLRSRVRVCERGARFTPRADWRAALIVIVCEESDCCPPRILELGVTVNILSFVTVRLLVVEFCE